MNRISKNTSLDRTQISTAEHELGELAQTIVDLDPDLARVLVAEGLAKLSPAEQRAMLVNLLMPMPAN
jgi:hypothetical protein